MNAKPPAQRCFVGAAMGAAWLSTGALWATAHAQTTYPTKPIKLIVGYPPGARTTLLPELWRPHWEPAGSAGTGGKQAGCQRHHGGRPGRQVTRRWLHLAAVQCEPAGNCAASVGQVSLRCQPGLYCHQLGGPTPEAIAVGPSLPVKNFQELLELAKTGCDDFFLGQWRAAAFDDRACSNRPRRGASPMCPTKAPALR